MKTIYQIFFALFITLNTSWALDQFACECKATGPGYEATNKQTGGIDKICSYQCKCLGWDTKVDPKTKISVATNAVPNIILDVKSLATSAASKEHWDFGSHVCHGQYSYKSNLGDPNWKIVVKFDTFFLYTSGDVSYSEDHGREIAMGMRESGFKYTKTAAEIAQSIKDQLKKF